MTESDAAAQRILVLEDDDLLRELISTVVESMGFRVLAAGNVDEALAAVAQGPFDLIISDVRLPGAPDGALYHRVRETDPDQAGRFLFVTGDILNPQTRTLVEQSGCPVVSKPFGLAELRRAVLGVLSPDAG